MALILDGTDGITSSGGTNVLQDDAVITANIADGAVTDAKIAAMAAAKLTGRVPTSNVNLGGVLRVVSVIKTDTFTTTSSSFVDITGLAVSITPTSATSKILVMAQVVGGNTQTGGGSATRLLRNSTEIAIGDSAGSRQRTSTASFFAVEDGATKQVAVTFLDSPNTTSAITYKMQTQATAGTTAINRSVNDADSDGRNRAVSTITVMEIAA